MTTQTGNLFSLGIAKICAEASRLAYESATVETPLAHALVQDHDFGRVIAFRGTANLRDALTDGECWRTGEGVHFGFAKAYSSIALELLPEIHDDSSPIYFTGHSLGGALSVLAAFAFAKPGDQLYTFGQPRVGSAKFVNQCAEKLAGRHFRFVNQEDIVPRVPLYISGFRHSGEEIFFDSFGQMRFGAPLWLKLTSDIYGTWLDYKLRKQIAQVSDHGIAHYCALLESQTALNSVPA